MIEIPLDKLSTYVIPKIFGGYVELELVKIDKANGIAILRVMEDRIESVQN